MSVGSDDSGSSDLTSCYCLDCDTTHDLGSDALPFVCGTKYSSDEEIISKDNIDIGHVPASQLARYHVFAIDPVMGVEIPTGGNTGHGNQNRQRTEAEASTCNNSTVMISQEEWNIAQDAVVNNTRFPMSVSQGTLTAYHSILEKNRVRLAREQADLNRRRREADLLIRASCIIIIATYRVTLQEKF
jgi:hypothetical protein